MALDSPTEDPKTNFKTVLLTMDNIITGVYALECVLKIISKGFLFNKGAYLRNIWNVIDFFSLLVSIQSLIF